MAKTIRARMICKDFDNTCLEGGCGYCNTNGTLLLLGTIRRQAEKKGLMPAYLYGLEHDFHNAKVVWGDE